MDMRYKRRNGRSYLQHWRQWWRCSYAYRLQRLLQSLQKVESDHGFTELPEEVAHIQILRMPEKTLRII